LLKILGRQYLTSRAKMLDWLYTKNGHLEVKPYMMTTADDTVFINCKTRK